MLRRIPIIPQELVYNKNIPVVENPPVEQLTPWRFPYGNIQRLANGIENEKTMRYN
jgi:hypothetical protein